MSLFDRDSGLSSSAASSASSSDGEGDGEASLPVRAPPVQPRSTNTAPSAPLTVLEQRRRMAEADAAGRRFGLAGAPWRGELLRRLPTSTAQTSSSSASPSSVEASKFGNSISAAMHLRREEKERLLLRRLQQQRRAEEQGSAGRTLAQKDVEVGVFVTASYRAVLQRSIRPSAEDSQGAKTESEKGSGDDAAEAEDDPLAAYLRQLESQRLDSQASPAPLPSEDYYDRVMKAPLREKEKQGDDHARDANEQAPTADGTENASVTVPVADDPPIVPPTLAELQDLIGTPAELPSAVPAMDDPTLHTEVAPQCGLSASSPSSATRQGEHSPIEDAERDAHSAVLAHARLVYDTREAGRKRTATDATVQACARRCDDRITSSLFLS